MKNEKIQKTAFQGQIRKIKQGSQIIVATPGRLIDLLERKAIHLDQINYFVLDEMKGKFVKIKYCMQLPTPTPQFVFFANLPQYVKEAYKRFLENKIRENWDFQGVPIDIYIREK